MERGITAETVIVMRLMTESHPDGHLTTNSSTKSSSLRGIDNRWMKRKSCTGAQWLESRQCMNEKAIMKLDNNISSTIERHSKSIRVHTANSVQQW